MNKEIIGVELPKMVIDYARKNNFNINELVNESILIAMRKQKTIIKPNNVVKYVCQLWNINEQTIKSNTRKREVVEARAAAYYVLRKKKLSVQKIGGIFNRDHASVLHGLGQIEYYKFNSKEFTKKYNNLLNLF